MIRFLDKIESFVKMSLNSKVFQLTSGLKVVHISKENEIGVRTQLTYNFGSNGESDIENYGWAHVVEHMIFKGTEQPGAMDVDVLNYTMADLEDKYCVAGLGFRLDDWLRGMRADWKHWQDTSPNEESISFKERMDLFLPTFLTKSRDGQNDVDFPLDIFCDLLVSLDLFYLSETDINSLARQYGAMDNAFTSRTQTSYFFECGKNALPLFLTILGQCMNHASMKDEHLRSEILAVLQEMSKDNVSTFRAEYNDLLMTIFGDHFPEFSHSTIGTTKALESISGERLKKWYKTHYQAKNATLLVLTPILSKEEVKRMISTIEVAFESAVEIQPRHQKRESVNVEEEKQRIQKHGEIMLSTSWIDSYTEAEAVEKDCIRRIVYHQCAVSDDILLCWSFPCVSKTTLFGAGEQFAYILSHGVEGRLNIALRGGVSSVNAWWDQTKDHCLLFVSFCPLKHMNSGDVEDLIGRIVREIEKPLTEKEIERAQLIAEGQHIHSQDTLSSLASSVVECLNSFRGVNRRQLKTHLDSCCLGLKPVVSPKDLKALQTLCARFSEAYYGIHMKPPTKQIKEDLEKKLSQKMKEFVSFTQNFKRQTPLETPFLFENLFQYERTKAISANDLKNQLKMEPQSHFVSYSLYVHSQSPSVQLVVGTINAVIASAFASMVKRSGLFLLLQKQLEAYLGGLSFNATSASIWVDKRSHAYRSKPISAEWLATQLQSLVYTDELRVLDDKDRFQEVLDELTNEFKHSSNQSISVALRYCAQHELPLSLQGWKLEDQLKKVEDLRKKGWAFVLKTVRRLIWLNDKIATFESWVHESSLQFNSTSSQEDKNLHPLVDLKQSPQHLSTIECSSQRLTVIFETPVTPWKRSDGHTWLVERALLNSMLFGGLGSVMYQIREKTGLFYNAFGRLGFGPTDHHRVNLMCIPVDPSQIERIQMEVKQQMGSVEAIQDACGFPKNCAALCQAQQQLFNQQWKSLVCSNNSGLAHLCWEFGFLDGLSKTPSWDDIQKRVRVILEQIQDCTIESCLSLLTQAKGPNSSQETCFDPCTIVGQKV